MTRILVAILTGSILMLPGPAAAAVEPGLKCQQLKLKARAALGKCLAKKEARAIGGEPEGSATCRGKFSRRIAKADRKAAKAGASCRFTDNQDETLTDLNTGLMWEKKLAAGSGCVHCLLQLSAWSRFGSEPDGTAFTWSLGQMNGATSADGSASSGCFAGYCDWRLPTLAEVQGLYSSGFHDPAVDPGFANTAPGHVWTTTVFSGNPNLVWQVYMRDGTLLLSRKAGWSMTRAVRGGF